MPLMLKAFILFLSSGVLLGNCTRKSAVNSKIISIIEKAFKNAALALHRDQNQKNDFLKKGKDKHVVSSSQGQLDLFTFEDSDAHQISIEGILFTEAIKYLKDHGVTLSDLKTKFNKEWRKVTAKYPLTRPVIQCNTAYPYRTADGSCNNIHNVLWGKAETIQPRYLDPDYGDGVDSPRVKSVTGKYLPSARKVSNLLMKCDRERKSDKNSVMVMAWGQFLDHDIVATPVSKGKNNTSIKCCGVKEKRPECFPIKIPKDDGYFKTDCLNFVRSAEGVKADSSPGPREQINQVTSYIDASAVYGSNHKMMKDLRLGKNGLLKTSRFGLLPPRGKDTCRLTHRKDFCMFAGDFRVNVVPNLSLLHLLFVREHNRIAKILTKLNPTWNDERVFQETRKIIAAYIQQISYEEYLTEILDNDSISKYKLCTTFRGFEKVYNRRTDASIRNAFAAAAFRFGHAQITSSVLYYKKNHDIEIRSLEETFHNPHMLQYKHGRHIPDLGRWVVYNNSIKADRCFVSSVRDKLFIDKDKHSFDLAALNIQRGRDHGIPSYVKWRSWCGLSKVRSFDSGKKRLIDHDRKTIKQLRKAYRSVHDIDLFAGGISEIHLPNADVGPTFACILGRQFQALKEGDRFWYENENCKTGFTKDQLNEIKKIKLSKLMCQNLKIDVIQRNVFRVPDDGRNRPMKCGYLQDIDFNYWKEDSLVKKN